MMTLPYAEPYKIKMTEAIRTSTREEREAWIREARYNLFKLRSDQVTIDLLTDSGTGSMSDRQWAAMMTGDESYAGASSYFRLKTTVAELFGMPWFLPTHQGRAAENVIFSALLKEGDIVPGNSHFDTTKGHIEFRRCHAVDCTIDAAADTQLELPFKGEMDLAKLKKVLAENPREKIPCVVLTVTNNTAGGQPVSMRNIRETAELCRRYGVPLLMDSARFAENAYFIKTREEGYASKTIKEIVREMYDWADIMTISAKKDGVVNMGGFVAMRSEELYKKAMSFSIMFEGYVTYGGMSGRDMDALAVGLDENASGRCGCWATCWTSTASPTSVRQAGTRSSWMRRRCFRTSRRSSSSPRRWPWNSTSKRASAAWRSARSSPTATPRRTRTATPRSNCCAWPSRAASTPTTTSG